MSLNNIESRRRQFEKFKSINRNQKQQQFKKFKPNRGAQREVLKLMMASDAPPIIWMCAGIGAGKTILGAALTCWQVVKYPERRKLIVAASYDQLQLSTLNTLVRFCEDYGIPYEPRRQDIRDSCRSMAARREIKIAGNSITCVSADNFLGEKQIGRGQEFRYFWGDESDYYAEAFDVILGRLSRGPGKGCHSLITSSINRYDPFGGLYKYFAAPERTQYMIERYKLIQASTKENIYLDSNYYDDLAATFEDDATRQIELEAQFVAPNSSTRVFAFFSRKNHLVKPFKWQQKYENHLLLSFDFNINPATCIAAVTIAEKTYVVREWKLPNTTSFELSQNVIYWLQENQIFSVKITGDSTGNNRVAQSRTSNWDIILESFKEEDIATILDIPSKNPLLEESANGCNRMLRQNRVYIFESCKFLINDLEVVRWKERGKIDKSNLSATHLSDCFRYLLHLTGRKTPKVPAMLL